MEKLIDLAKFGVDPALIQDNASIVTYLDLNLEVQEISEKIRGTSLIFLLGSNTVQSICVYLAALAVKVPIVLLPNTMNSTKLASLVETYKPSWIFAGDRKEVDSYDFETLSTNFNYFLFKSRKNIIHETHPDLRLLFSTSGSTGSSKLVQISERNLLSNTNSIINALGIKQDDRAITTLPMHYSYGLSIINTHLNSGASIILNDKAVSEREFWETLKLGRATTFGGVPLTYELLSRATPDWFDGTYLETLTQAGGKLREDLVIKFQLIAKQLGMKFFIMYGQTEATARMSILDSNMVEFHPGSIGKPISGGYFHVIDDGGKKIESAHQVGELVYSGPNVCLGYANAINDFRSGDTNGGILRTGDLGYFDNNGYYYVTGRKNRLCKILGHRVNLDEIEVYLRQLGYDIYVIEVNEKVYLCSTNEEKKASCLKQAGNFLQLNYRALKYVTVKEFPRNEAGKIQYSLLKQSLPKVLDAREPNEHQ